MPQLRGNEPILGLNMEARTTLDIVFLKKLKTQPHDDSSKNDMDAREQEETMGQP